MVITALGITWIIDGLEVTMIASFSAVLQEPGSLGFSGSEIGLLNTAYLTGAVLGALVFGYLTDRLGRKKLFSATLGLYLVSAFLTAFSWNFASFALFRFLTGAAIGGEYAAINSAIDELIPSRVRGWADLAINGTFWVGAATGSLASIVLLNPSASRMGVSPAYPLHSSFLGYLSQVLAQENIMARTDTQAGHTVHPAADTNPDPITGEPGAHPVGAGLGAAAAGAAAGAAGGAMAGPVGAVAGAVIGGVAGGLAGKGIAESIDPTAEHAYWRDQYTNRPYYDSATSYDEYAPAYQYGWESRARYHDRSWDQVESDLSRDWGAAKAKSRLNWEKAKHATRDAWDRIGVTVSGRKVTTR